MQEAHESLWRKEPLQTRRFSSEDLEERFRAELEEAVRRTNLEIEEALADRPILKTVAVKREVPA